MVFASQGRSPRDANSLKTAYNLTCFKPRVDHCTCVVDHRDLYKGGFTEFINHIITHDIKRNYSCSGLNILLIRGPSI